MRVRARRHPQTARRALRGASNRLLGQEGHPDRLAVAALRRVYEYDSEHLPINAFNDLQSAKGTVTAMDGTVTIAVPAKSMTFLTTDYEDRVPAEVVNVRIANGVLSWAASKEPEHCYYRVYRDGTQIASTVATSLAVPGAGAGKLKRFSVKSVDKWGNEGK